MSTMQQDDFRASTADLKGVIIDGAIYIAVSSLWTDTCAGCHFESDDPCPHQRKLIYCGGREDNADHILIEDTPEAIAAYVARRLT